MQQRRFPARNPFGDKVIHRYIWSEGDDLSITEQALDPYAFTAMRMDIGNGTVGGVSYDGGIPSQMGSSPGLNQNIALFQRYRVYQFICVTTFTNLSNVPVLIWHQPYAGNSNGTTTDAVLPLVANIPEQRWTKSKMLGPAGSNRSVTKLISRYNPYKIVSFDRGSAIGDAYGYVASTTGPAISAPSYGSSDVANALNFPWFRYGITAYDDLVPQDAGSVPRVAYLTKVYLKVQHFDRVPLTQ